MMFKSAVILQVTHMYMQQYHLVQFHFTIQTWFALKYCNCSLIMSKNTILIVHANHYGNIWKFEFPTKFIE